MTTTDRLAIFLAGVGLGLGGALLWAPSAGDETRRRLKKGAADAADRINGTAAEAMAQGKQTWADLQDRGNQTIGDLKERFRDTVDEAAGATKAAAGTLVDTSRDLAHTAGRKMEEGGKRLQEA